jgi:hypothetical protein
VFVGEVSVAVADVTSALLVSGVGAELMLRANALFTGAVDDVSAQALGHPLESR